MPFDSNAISELADSYGIPQMQLSVYNGSDEYSSLLTGSNKTIEKSGDEVFQAASLGKVLFSYIVMRLVDEGKMDLDTPVCKYTDIDRFVDKQMASRLTPRIILSHTSGLYNWAYSPTRDEWATSPISFHFDVDLCYGYSGEAFAFLQRAAEAATGKTLNELAKQYIFEPFDMPLSSYGWESEYDSLAVEGFDREGNAKGRWESIKPNCAYTLRTTSKELMNFLVHAVLNGEGLSKEVHKMWLTPRSHAVRFKDDPHRDCDDNMYWGLGIGIKVSFDSSGNPVPEQYWHWGDNDYWKSLFVVDPSRGLIMNYMTNSAKGHDICDEVCRLTMGTSYDIQAWIGNKDDL